MKVRGMNERIRAAKTPEELDDTLQEEQVMPSAKTLRKRARLVKQARKRFEREKQS